MPASGPWRTFVDGPQSPLVAKADMRVCRRDACSKLCPRYVMLVMTNAMQTKAVASAEAAPPHETLLTAANDVTK